MPVLRLDAIHPRLYIGDLEDALKFKGTTVCVAGKSTCARASADFSVLLDDLESVGEDEFRTKMALAARKIHAALNDRSKNKVLVHCYAGINRSASAIVAYALMYTAPRCLVRAVCLKGPAEIIDYIRFKNKTRRDLPAVTNRSFDGYLRRMKYSRF